jgi:anthranilate synthase component 1
MNAVTDCVPVTETWIEDTETPVSAFLKLRAAAPEEPAFLLESAEQGRVGRFSFIGYRPRKVLRWSLGDPGDPYALLQHELDAVGTQQPEGLELPFGGGAVGMFAYDLVRTVEALGEPNPDEIGLPDLALMLTDTLVAFDHFRRTISVVAHPSDDADTARVKVDAIREVLAGPLPRPAVTPEVAYRSAPEFVSNMTREHFEANVARIIDYVYAGDAFQVVPSQRWSAKTPVSGFSIYRGLRAVNPSPYMYYLDFGDFEIAGASPEPLVTVTGRRVSTTPIAGTRPRGATAEQDAEYARELLADEKERAEHVMLVDLGRNDLGRVCEYGSVRVDDLMVVENYSHVMHIVSNVSGTLRPEVSALDALKAVLPAGTLSGAPKVRAMQIIDELETVKRCGYGGAIGWASYGGDLDTCIHIRTAVIKDGTVYVQAGGGTVADAKPANEYEESVNKSRALRAAIETAIEQPTWE